MWGKFKSQSNISFCVFFGVVGAVTPQQVGKTACEGYTLPLSCLATVVIGHSPSASLGAEGESGGRVKGCTVGGAGLWQ